MPAAGLGTSTIILRVSNYKWVCSPRNGCVKIYCRTDNIQLIELIEATSGAVGWVINDSHRWLTDHEISIDWRQDRDWRDDQQGQVFSSFHELTGLARVKILFGPPVGLFPCWIPLFCLYLSCVRDIPSILNYNLFVLLILNLTTCFINIVKFNLFF